MQADRLCARSWTAAVLLAFAFSAHGVERAGDADGADELLRLSNAVGVIQDDLLSRCENGAVDERFDRYRRYDQSMAAWNRIDSVRDALAGAIAAPTSDDARVRLDLRDHARFALWELDEHIARVATALPDADEVEARYLRDDIRLARQARIVVERLAIEQ